MLCDAQKPERIESLPYSQERIMKTVRGRQVLGEFIGADRRRIRMEKRNKERRQRRVENAQACRHRERDLPIWAGC